MHERKMTPEVIESEIVGFTPVGDNLVLRWGESQITLTSDGSLALSNKNSTMHLQADGMLHIVCKRYQQQCEANITIESTDGQIDLRAPASPC